MADVSFVKMSSKGQVVIPDDIRERRGFNPGDIFVPIDVKEGVLLKRIDMSDLRRRYERLAKNVSDRWKERKVTKGTIDEAVRWARRSS